MIAGDSYQMVHWPEFQNFMVRLGAWGAFVENHDVQREWLDSPDRTGSRPFELVIELFLDEPTRVCLRHDTQERLLCSRKESSYESFHSPEFKVLCARMGLPYDLPIRDITLFLIARGGIQIHLNILAQDTLHEPYLTAFPTEPGAAPAGPGQTDQDPGGQDSKGGAQGAG